MNPKLRTALIDKGLSVREAEVVILVAKGLSNKDVGNQLCVVEKTVKFHLTNIFKKMGLKSRAQLIVWCLPYLGFEMPDVVEKVVVVKEPATRSPADLPTGDLNSGF